MKHKDKPTIWDGCGQSYQYKEYADLKFIVDEILKDGSSVFEGATGTGMFPTMLRKYGFKGRYLGSDYVDTFLEHARANNPNEQFMKVDLINAIPLPDKSYDYFIVRHGMEHVYPFDTFFAEAKRITRKKVILSFWIDLKENTQIRYNEEGKWNVNYYSRKEFFDCAAKGGLVLVAEPKILCENNVTSHLYIFEV